MGRPDVGLVGDQGPADQGPRESSSADARRRRDRLRTDDPAVRGDRGECLEGQLLPVVSFDDGVRRPARGRRSAPVKYLPRDQANALRNAAEGLDQSVVVNVLLDTGLRLAEFCAIRRPDVDWQARRLRVAGKGGKVRTVPLTRHAAELLAAILTGRDAMPLRPRTVQRLLERTANRAGILERVFPHLLRHTFAVESLRRGISTPALQRVLGHARLAYTERYCALSPEDALAEYRDKW